MVRDYRDDFFVTALNRINTQKLTTILDTCFSGGMTKASCAKASAKSMQSIVSCKVVTTAKRLKGLVLTASLENQMAWEIKNKGGLFTQELLKALGRKGATMQSAFSTAKKNITIKTRNTACFQSPQILGQ